MDKIYASPVATEKHIFISSREGMTVVIDADNKLNVVAKNQLDDGINASIAIVGNELFIRSDKFVYCIAEPKNGHKAKSQK